MGRLNILSHFVTTVSLLHPVFSTGPCSLKHWRNDCRMANTLQTFSDVLSVRQINGVTMSNLTARALPHKNVLKHGIQRGRYKTIDECVNMCQAMPPSELSSFSGFIAKNQTLRSVLESDWDFVHTELNSTHIEIAGHLGAMLSNPACHPMTTATPCEITYDSRDLPGNTITQPTGPQKIAVVEMVTNGCQCSMFWNYNNPNTDWGNDGWACTYSLTNVGTGVSIPAIVSSQGLARCYGFAEFESRFAFVLFFSLIQYITIHGCF